MNILKAIGKLFVVICVLFTITTATIFAGGYLFYWEEAKAELNDPIDH